MNSPNSGNGAYSDAYELLRLHTLVENCPDIPIQAREADVAHVEDRLFDDSLFRKITENTGQGVTEGSEADSMQRRVESLAPFIGRRLVCMVIRLPGVRYTIEIDPMEERIVHWEWQTQ
ncbi:MAG: hypothetical protein GXP15_06520 [Gammaproteobacteria bacterium]|nr:hypothetical protein [Gammaproteobacteria bacterium]